MSVQPKNRDLVLGWLFHHPGLHCGLDIAKGSGVGRSKIYFYLGQLEERGEVQRIVPQKLGAAMPRPLYQASPHLRAKHQ